MGVIELYIICALATSLAGMYELVLPTLNELKMLRPEHNMLEYRWITYSVFLLIFTIAAPLVFLSCIIPSWSERFRDSLVLALIAP